MTLHDVADRLFVGWHRHRRVLQKTDKEEIMTRTQLCYVTKGHLGQYEDWWYLIQNDDGSIEIENEWDHVEVNGLAKNAGAKRYSIEDGLQKLPGTGYQKAKEILASLQG